jgi:hypothetical protein
MKCFYHPQIDAVAICKNCSKGLCMECVADVGNGVACKGKCEAEVQAVNQMIQRGIRAKNVSGYYYKRLAAIFALIGLSTIAISLLSLKDGNSKSIVFIPVGLISLFAAYFYFSMSKKNSGEK